MKNTLDATETPGTVLMISNAGRIVAAVVWVAPETMPSARPVCDHQRAEVVDVADHVVRQVER